MQQRGDSMNELYQKALTIKVLYNSGCISREEAKKEIKPYAIYFNDTSKRIAEKYNRKPQKFSFNSFMR